jgi:hypothetical protein
MPAGQDVTSGLSVSVTMLFDSAEQLEHCDSCLNMQPKCLLVTKYLHFVQNLMEISCINHPFLWTGAFVTLGWAFSNYDLVSSWLSCCHSAWVQGWVVLGHSTDRWKEWLLGLLWSGHKRAERGSILPQWFLVSAGNEQGGISGVEGNFKFGDVWRDNSKDELGNDSEVGTDRLKTWYNSSCLAHSTSSPS